MNEEERITLESALRSRDLPAGQGLLPGIRTALLASSEWHMRRVSLSMRRFLPPSIALVCRPTPGGCARENRRRSSACRETVRREHDPPVLFTETGALPPFEP